jgi:DNA polymerase-4
MILHLDLDSFFASAHRAVDPSLHNIPIAVGGRSNLKIFEKKKVGIKLYNANSGAFVNPVFYNDKENSFNSFFVDKIKGKEKIRGIITTASYEARAYGVKTGMSVNEALGRCPNLKVLPPNYMLYHELSHKLHQFLKREIPKIEQFSIDEFFGDVYGWVEEDEALEFAKYLKNSIDKEFKLPISIGISSGKWIAKLATNFAKPNGVHIVKKDEIPNFIKDISIEEFPGIGRGFQKRLKKHFINTLGEASEHKRLFYGWKKPGIQLYHRIIGDDNEGISKTNDRKSIGISRTFDPIKSRSEIQRRITILARHIIYLVLKQNVNPTTYYISIRYDYGARVKNGKTINRLFNEQLCKDTFLEMFKEMDTSMGYVTKLSMSVSNFSHQKHKILSLVDFEEDYKQKKITSSMQKLREKYTLDIIKTGSEL